MATGPKERVELLERVLVRRAHGIPSHVVRGGVDLVHPPGLPERKVVDDAPWVEDAQPAKPIPVIPLPHLIEMGLRPQIDREGSDLGIREATALIGVGRGRRRHLDVVENGKDGLL